MFEIQFFQTVHFDELLQNTDLFVITECSEMSHLFVNSLDFNINIFFVVVVFFSFIQIVICIKHRGSHSSGDGRLCALIVMSLVRCV